MELSSEFVEKNQLSTEQVTAITSEVGTHIANIKQEWDGKANENAEKILEGAAKSVSELTGIQRDKGQKIADYISFAGEKFFEGTKNTLITKEKELEEKIKNSKGDEVLKQELKETKEKLDGLKQKEALFSEYEKEDYKTKYQEANEKLSNQTKDIAFNSIKPTFPDTVNAYEAKGKWKEFIKDTLNKYSIKKDGEDWIAVDKENEYKIVKLDSLVKEDEQIQELLKGREQKGLGSKGKKITIEGVPFEVPATATPPERQKAIKDYLASLNILHTSAEYSKKFAELNTKILQKNAS
jgi:hypothetical protein